MAINEVAPRLTEPQENNAKSDEIVRLTGARSGVDSLAQRGLVRRHVSPNISRSGFEHSDQETA